MQTEKHLTIFEGTDLHSRMCEFVYQTSDWYDLNDSFGDYSECENPDFNIRLAIFNMSLDELAAAIKYAVENEPELHYVREFNTVDYARADAQRLLTEYNNTKN